jgi:hypothetical protein
MVSNHLSSMGRPRVIHLAVIITAPHFPQGFSLQGEQPALLDIRLLGDASHCFARPVAHVGHVGTVRCGNLKLNLRKCPRPRGAIAGGGGADPEQRLTPRRPFRNRDHTNI